jgi:ABC-type glycerol-3-phosphate transport system substrate-binding protein
LYDPQQFAAASLPLPELDWSTQSFEEALRGLYALNPDNPPYKAAGSGADQLLILIYAYGGWPFDQGSSGIETDFTNPATVEALRDVLDLVKADLIAYVPPASSGSFAMLTGGVPDGIRPGSVNSFMLSAMNRDSQSPGIGFVNYPVSPSGPVVLNYRMNAAYISARAQDPMACYDWIMTLSRNPAAQQNMPANLTLLDDPVYQATISPDLLAFYQDYAALMHQPDAVIASSFQQVNDPRYYAATNELVNAINAYLFDDVDLLIALEDAQRHYEEFNACMGDIDLTQLNPETLSEADLTRLRNCFERYLPSS